MMAACTRIVSNARSMKRAKMLHLQDERSHAKGGINHVGYCFIMHRDLHEPGACVPFMSDDH